MPFTLNADLAHVLAASIAVPVTDRGDVPALREVTNAILAAIDANEPDSPAVVSEDFEVAVSGDTSILARWYRKTGSNPGSAVVYLHGGGMVCGSVQLYDRVTRKIVQQTGVPFLSVDYRLSPEHPGTTLVDDSHAALLWLVEHSSQLGVDTSRIAIMGDSGGGGVAAGVAIAARDSGTPVAMQILIYPMLDDRNLEPDPLIAPFANWTYDNNFTGWNALLAGDRGTDSVPAVAAPSRLTEFAGLAPAFIDVGELDIFRDESVRYATQLWQAGVSCELHVRPGCIHAFERLAPNAGVSVASWSDRYRAITSF